MVVTGLEIIRVLLRGEPLMKLLRVEVVRKFL